MSGFLIQSEMSQRDLHLEISFWFVWSIYRRRLLFCQEAQQSAMELSPVCWVVCCRSLSVRVYRCNCTLIFYWFLHWLPCSSHQIGSMLPWRNSVALQFWCSKPKIVKYFLYYRLESLYFGFCLVLVFCLRIPYMFSLRVHTILVTSTCSSSLFYIGTFYCIE